MRNLDFDPNTKTITISGGTKENPLSFADIKQEWVDSGLPLDAKGAIVVKEGYTLNYGMPPFTVPTWRP